MRVLVTGGAGYVGSHFVLHAANAGWQVVVVDDLSQGHRDAIDQRASFVHGKCGDRELMRQTMSQRPIDAVVHFAARISVEESTRSPQEYWEDNVCQTLALLAEVVRAGVPVVVLSSSGTVYGNTDCGLIGEDRRPCPVSPYGSSKLAAESALREFSQAYGFRHAILRYFNAAGADQSGTLGERHEPEIHLIPRAIDAALGVGPAVPIHGRDWPTADGTCIRDYVHVQDLAEAHLRVVEKLAQAQTNMLLNLGAGHGMSVANVVRVVEDVTSRPVPVREALRRAGDPPCLVADISAARAEIGFTAQRSRPQQIVRDALVARTKFRAAASTRV